MSHLLQTAKGVVVHHYPKMTSQKIVLVLLYVPNYDKCFQLCNDVIFLVCVQTSNNTQELVSPSSLFGKPLFQAPMLMHPYVTTVVASCQSLAPLLTCFSASRILLKVDFLSGRLVQGWCYFREVLNISSILACKPQKTPHLGLGSWSRKVSGCSDFIWVHLNSISGYLMAKKRHLIVAKETFGWYQSQICTTKLCEYHLQALWHYVEDSFVCNHFVQIDETQFPLNLLQQDVYGSASLQVYCTTQKEFLQIQKVYNGTRMWFSLFFFFFGILELPVPTRKI